MPDISKVCAQGGKVLARGGKVQSCCCCIECEFACCKVDGTCETLSYNDCLAISGHPGVRWGWPGPPHIAWAYACCDNEECIERLNPDGIELTKDGESCGQICADDDCCPGPPEQCPEEACCICVGWPEMPDVIDVIFPAVTPAPCPTSYALAPCNDTISGGAACCTEICENLRATIAGILADGISLTRAGPCTYTGSGCGTVPAYTCPSYPNTPGFPLPLTCGAAEVCVTVTLVFGGISHGINISFGTSTYTCGRCYSVNNCGDVAMESATTGDNPVGTQFDCGLTEVPWNPGDNFTKDDSEGVIELVPG